MIQGYLVVDKTAIPNVVLRTGVAAGIHWLQLNCNLSALRYIPSLNNLQMMPRSREVLMDFKMSIAIKI